ncbi:hypothetical protein ACTFIT_001779 [Dictyostelium discoideum]
MSINFTRFTINDILLYKFTLQKKNKYNCPICFEFIYGKKVYQCKSGHFACQECWEKSLEIKKECMICRLELNSLKDLSRCLVIEQDFGKKKCCCIYSFTDEIIKQKTIGGENGEEKEDEKTILDKDEENGCSKILKVDDILSHVSGCNYKIEKCPIEGCSETFRTISKESHLNECSHKLVKCEHCLRDDIKKNQIQFHHNNCPKVIIDCLQDCSMKIERGEIKNHEKNDCGNTRVFCKYYEQGCYIKMERSKLENHLENVNHQKFMGQLIESLTSQLKVLNELYPPFYKNKWIISNYQKKIYNPYTSSSPVFYFENKMFYVDLKKVNNSLFSKGISLSIRSRTGFGYKYSFTVVNLLDKGKSITKKKIKNETNSFEDDDEINFPIIGLNIENGWLSLDDKLTIKIFIKKLNEKNYLTKPYQ